MSNVRFNDVGRFMLPPGVTSKGRNFLKRGDLIPDVVLRAMGQKRVDTLMDQGKLTTREFFDGKPDTAGRPTGLGEPGAEEKKGRGRPKNPTPTPDPAPSGDGVGPKE